MFDFDAGKLVVFGIVALAVIPPKDLPRVLRTVGKYVGQMRRMASDFQGQFMEAIKEAELDSVKKEIESINAEASKIDTSFDPASLMREQVTQAVHAPAHEAPAPADPSPYETVRAESPAIAAPVLEHAPAAAPAPEHAPPSAT
jgi:sec-independent protein translocase protein TatB